MKKMIIDDDRDEDENEDQDEDDKFKDELRSFGWKKPGHLDAPEKWKKPPPV